VNLEQAESTTWRVADPDWEDPFDGSYSMRLGQRWNAKGSFPVTYLNANEATAQANVELMIGKLAGIGVDVDDVEAAQLPVVIPCIVPDRTVLDVLGDQGCLDVGLEITYPLGPDGSTTPHSRCQPIGQSAWDNELDGIACRSAALLTPEGEELAWFDRPGKRLAASGPPRRYRP
jgi:RES domain